MDRVCNIFQASHSQQVVRHKLLHAAPTLAHPIILCKTCSVLLCVLEQSRVDNAIAGSNWFNVGPGCTSSYRCKENMPFSK